MTGSYIFCLHNRYILVTFISVKFLLSGVFYKSNDPLFTVLTSTVFTLLHFSSNDFNQIITECSACSIKAPKYTDDTSASLLLLAVGEKAGSDSVPAVMAGAPYSSRTLRA